MAAAGATAGSAVTGSAAGADIAGWDGLVLRLLRRLVGGRLSLSKE